MQWLPGAVTATEVQRARELGILDLKFFPAGSSGGPSQLKSLAAVYADVRFLPHGRGQPRQPQRLPEHPQCRAVGGSWLTPSDLVAAEKWDVIAEQARASVAQARGRAPSDRAAFAARVIASAEVDGARRVGGVVSSQPAATARQRRSRCQWPSQQPGVCLGRSQGCSDQCIPRLSRQPHAVVPDPRCRRWIAQRTEHLEDNRQRDVGRFNSDSTAWIMAKLRCCCVLTQWVFRHGDRGQARARGAYTRTAQNAMIAMLRKSIAVAGNVAEHEHNEHEHRCVGRHRCHRKRAR